MNIKHHTRQHTLNQSQLKSLTDNLRLRLRYAKLKVINGWHNQTLNEIESTIYYLLPHHHPDHHLNQQKTQTQQIKLPPQKKSLLETSLSSSTSSGSSSKSSDPHDLSHQIQKKIHLHSHFPPPPLPDHPSLNNPTQPSSDRSNPETAFLIQKSHLLSSTTLTLPLKFSTPFKKTIGSTDDHQSDQFSSESNRFWPTRNLGCSSTGSASSLRFTMSTNRKNRKSSMENLVFKMTGMESSTTTSLKEENEDLFQGPPMHDFQELYKNSTPASFLFNYHHPSILDSSSAKKSSKPALLNSVSPVRIRSHLHSQSHPHSRLVRLASHSLASPTPTRTQKSLNNSFGSSSIGLIDHDKTDQPQGHQAQASGSAHRLVPEDDDDDDEDDKENLIDSYHPYRPSPLKLRSSLLKFKLHPGSGSLNDTPIEDVVSNPSQIGLDDLDQLVWE